MNCLVHVQILPELGLQCNKSDLFLVGVGLCQVVCHGEELEEAAEDQQVWVSLLLLGTAAPTTHTWISRRRWMVGWMDTEWSREQSFWGKHCSSNLKISNAFYAF